MQVLLISIFGVAGVLSRYYADIFFNPQGNRAVAVTFGVNIVGCAIAAVVFEISRRKTSFSPHVIQGLMVGFCGGFTTFSAYAVQSFSLMEQEGALKSSAISYFVLSPLLGVLTVFAVVTLSKHLFASPV